MVEIAGRQLGQLCGQSSSGNIGHIDKGASVGHLPNLIGNRIGHFFATHTNIGTPEAAYCIEVASAIAVVNIGTFSGSYWQSAFIGKGIENLPGMQKMCLIFLIDCVGIILIKINIGTAVYCRHTAPGELPLKNRYQGTGRLKKG